MKVMVVCKSHPGTHAAAMKRFVEENGLKVEPNVRVLSTSHGIGTSFILLESQDYGAIASLCNDWQAVVSVEAHVVISDTELVAHHKNRTKR